MTASRTTPARKTSKPAAAKTPSKVEDKPTFHFSIKQAEAEREEEAAENPVDPFTVEALNGEAIVFKDANAMGWQEASMMNMRDPHMAVRSMLEDDSVDLFYEQGDFANSVLRDLIRAWMEHYGVTPQGN